MKRMVQATVLFNLVPLVTGCGVDDYERQMLRAQVKVQSYDEANAVLGDPIELKMKDTIDGKAVEVDAPVFLRAPRGVASKPTGLLDGKMLYRYGRAGKEVPKGSADADSEAALGMLKEMYAATAIDRADLKIFAKDVLKSWRLENVNLQPSELKPTGATELGRMDFDDPKTSYASYFVRGAGPTMVGVVFQFEKGKRDAVRKVLDMAIEWMALDGKAGEAQRRYDKVRAAKNQPPAKS